MNASSSDFTDERQLFFTKDDNESQSEEETHHWRGKSRQEAKKWEANDEISTMRSNVKIFTVINGNTTLLSMFEIKDNARIREEQDNDLVLKNLKLNILGQPFEEVLLTTERQYKHYKTNEERIILKSGLHLRTKYGQTGSVKHYQVFAPQKFVEEVLRSLHADFVRHLGITKTIFAHREVILPKHGAVDQEVGHVVWAMHQGTMIR